MSFDSQEENKAFAEKFSFQYPLLCDTNRAMGMAYGACSDVGAANAGRVGVVIDEHGIIKEYEEKVNARTYPAELFERL